MRRTRTGSLAAIAAFVAGTATLQLAPQHAAFASSDAIHTIDDEIAEASKQIRASEPDAEQTEKVSLGRRQGGSSRCGREPARRC